MTNIRRTLSGGSDINKGRSKKWKRLLQFPHISYCIDLKDKIDCSYAFVVEHQPIGRLLFRSFCETKDLYSKCCVFLDSVESFEIQLNQTPELVAQDIIDKFMTASSNHAVDILTSRSDIISKCNNRLNDAPKARDVFSECTK